MNEIISQLNKSLERERFQTGNKFYDNSIYLELGNVILINGIDSRVTSEIADSISCYLNMTNNFKVIMFDKEHIDPKRIGFIKNFGNDPIRDFNYVKKNFFILEYAYEFEYGNIDKKPVKDLLKNTGCKVIVISNIENFENNGNSTYFFHGLKKFAENNDIIIICTTTPKSLRFNYENEYFPTKFYDVNNSMDALRYIDVVVNINKSSPDNNSTYGEYSDNNRYSFDVEKTKKGNIIFNK